MLLLAAGILGCGVFGAASLAQEKTAEAAKLSIDHAALTCVLKSQYPRIEARIDPVESVQRAWARFRSDAKGAYYAVPLRKEGDLYVGVLPMPKWLKSFEYYVEAIDQNAENTRTPEYWPVVVADANECRERGLSSSVAEASNLIVEKPSEAPPKSKPVPPGFSSHGTVGSVGAFDWSSRTTAFIAGGIVATVVGVTASLKGENPGTEPRPSDIYSISFRSSMPPPGSQVSVGRGSLTMTVNLRQIVSGGGPSSEPKFIRVDFFGTGNLGCLSMMAPAHYPAGMSEDFTISGPLVMHPGCSLPFTNSQASATLLLENLMFAPESTGYLLNVSYTFVR